MIPVWRTGFSHRSFEIFGGEIPVSTPGSRPPRGLSWMPQLSKAQLSKALLRRGLPCEGGCEGGACVRDGAGTAPCSPAASLGREQDPCHPGKGARLDWCCPSPQRRGNVGNPCRIQRWAKTIGCRAPAAEEPRYLSRLGIHPCSSSLHPRQTGTSCAWERPQQSGVPRPRASPAAAARRGHGPSSRLK